MEGRVERWLVGCILFGQLFFATKSHPERLLYRRVVENLSLSAIVVWVVGGCSQAERCTSLRPITKAVCLCVCLTKPGRCIVRSD